MRFKRLIQLLGVEKELHEVPRALRAVARELRAAAVGALHLTCADEAEFECGEAFQKHFSRHLLPPLKHAQASAFRLANLGGRYEPGTARLVENHFATPESAESFKLIVMKINSHVARDDELKYGMMTRYEALSYSCGALRALLDGGKGRHLADLEELFGVERLGMLRRVQEDVRPLAAAVMNARSQAIAACRDALSFTPETPTIYLVLPCITINLPGPDREVVCAHHVLDCRRRSEPVEEHVGLGGDPLAYEFRHVGAVLQVEDPLLIKSRDEPD